MKLLFDENGVDLDLDGRVVAVDEQCGLAHVSRRYCVHRETALHQTVSPGP